MFKKLLLAVVTFVATMGFAFAQVDVNKADQATLDGVKGIGPAISKTIIDERKKGGDFKDWADFENRVKGVGDKNSSKLSQAGLTVNGQAKSNAPAVAKEPKKTAKAAPAKAADAKVDAKADAKADTKADVKADAKAGAKPTKAEDKKAKADAKKAAADAKKDKAGAAATEPKK